MKKLSIIISVTMVLFTTVFSNAWCLCRVAGSDPAESACSACCPVNEETDHCGTKENSEPGHCYRSENDTEAVRPVIENDAPVLNVMAMIPVDYRAADCRKYKAVTSGTQKERLRTSSFVVLLI